MTSTPEKPLPSYLRTPNVPLHRAWNTWAADRYLDMIFQPLGVRVTPLLFSAAAGKALLPGPGHPVKLGAHSTDGSTVEAEVSHGGTVLDWSWGKLSAFDLAGGWKVRRHGEWGLRFWVVLVLTQEDGAVWRFDEERGIASTSVGPRTVAIKAERAPLLVTGHTRCRVGCRRIREPRLLVPRLAIDDGAGTGVALQPRGGAEQPVRRRHRRSRRPRDATGRAAGRTGAATGTRRQPRRDPRHHGLEHHLGWRQPPPLRHLLAQLGPQEVRRLRLLAERHGGQRPADLAVRRRPGARVPVDRAVGGDTGGKPSVHRHRQRRLGRPHPDAARLADHLGRLQAHRQSRRCSNSPTRSSPPTTPGSAVLATATATGSTSSALPMSDLASTRAPSWRPRTRASWTTRRSTTRRAGGRKRARSIAKTSASTASSPSTASTWHGSREALGRDSSGHKEDAERLRRKISEELWDNSRRIFANRLWSGRFVRSIGPTSFFPLLAGAANRDQTLALRRCTARRPPLRRHTGAAIGLPRGSGDHRQRLLARPHLADPQLADLARPAADRRDRRRRSAAGRRAGAVPPELAQPAAGAGELPPGHRRGPRPAGYRPVLFVDGAAALHGGCGSLSWPQFCCSTAGTTASSRCDCRTQGAGCQP